MKKVMMIVGGMLLMATVTFAQDSTGVQQTPQTPTQQQQAPEQTSTQSYTKDMVKITGADLPQSVKQTLSAPQYQGWDTAPVYRSKNNDMYVIEMGSGAETKTLRFSADGKPILE